MQIEVGKSYKSMEGAEVRILEITSSGHWNQSMGYAGDDGEFYWQNGKHPTDAEKSLIAEVNK